MIRRILCLLMLVGCTSAMNDQTKRPEEDPEEKWGKTIQQFENWDRKNSYPSDAVLFVGSSSIKLWPTRESFDGLAVINRGFGGSQISEVNYFAEKIVLRYAPKVIVFYAGDNDVAAGKSSKRVFDDYQKFVRLVHTKLPRTKVIFIAIKPSVRRWPLWPVMAKANKMIEDFSGSDDRLMYFDSATPLMAGDGRPDAKFFLEDDLHLNADGYRVWTSLLRPIIEEAVKPDTKRR